MRVTVHAVVARLPGWVSAGTEDYVRRLPKHWQLRWRDVPLADRSRGGDPARWVETEGQQLLRGIDAADEVIALDVAGTLLSTEALAEAVADWQMRGVSVALLIGGPDGLSAACLARARLRWSLGRLTLPHPLVRVVLAEQLYRAWSLTAGHPYHRA